NGRRAVLVNIRQALGGDTLKVVRDVDARLKSLGLPPSVSVTPFYDQSELVVGAANAVRDAILLGALLAGLVLFLFLRSVRLMAITAAVLP
ncbi:efflux RND transporter permease subunit, partial [Acinetobacter baumannii]